MKYSYKWLQEHTEGQLPPAAELARVITVKSFEVEGVEQSGDDTIFDIKVLPDRAHDALSHKGMAAEIAALFGLEMKQKPTGKTIIPTAGVPDVAVHVEDAGRCPRYIGVRADNISIGNSPVSLAGKLGAIGQRSINNIVDITNFILFDLGQPMHAFDAKKVAGAITVRAAKKGERMTTLDGRELELIGDETVIADDEGVLALAGVKGGKKAEIDTNTTSIIFESANFDPETTRRTSQRHNIKTDASKRYENGITSELAGVAMLAAIGYLAECCPGVRFGERSDIYPSPEGAEHKLSFTPRDINTLLGSSLTQGDVEEVLLRLGKAGFSYSSIPSSSPEDTAFTLSVPVTRLDLRIKEDIIEEIGRHYGYERIVPTLPILPRKGVLEKHFYYASVIREFLIERGYAEVFTYSFAVKNEGDVEVVNPVGKDRPYLRRSLVPGIDRALVANHYNAPFLEIADVRIFELGKVFTTEGERMRLTIGAMGGTKKRWKTLEEEFRNVCRDLPVKLGAQKAEHTAHPGDIRSVVEFDLDTLVEHLVEPNSTGNPDEKLPEVVYKPFSPYPFIVRDVALWVQTETAPESVEEIVRKNAGELAQKIYLFDTFEKDGKKSLAFRIVLQSFERTLEDAEANAVYEKVCAALRAKDKHWEVRD